MTWQSPTDEIRFHLDHVADYGALAQTGRFAEATPDTSAAVLAEAGRLCDEVLAPANAAGDLHPARLEDGEVISSPGFAEAFRQIAAGGWIGLAASPDHGGAGLPLVLATAVNEMMSGANLALQLNPLLTQGQIEALTRHAPEGWVRDTVLPKLVAGEWSGTMNLTEPQAGSDVGALATRAQPDGDGTFAITGSKIFITWGECDFVGNISHLVLARLPGAPAGTRGISLFLVPKFLPDTGARNAVHATRLEHKLGLHGSPTAEMRFEGAKGWLIGAEGGGMAAMFTMMNHARLGVAAQGVGIAEAALQLARAHAQTRVQGGGSIIGHPDVRRMLATMEADLFAARAIMFACALAIDMAAATGAPEWQARAGLLTPIAKAFCTDTGHDAAQTGIQIHGGMGYIEETGAARLACDVRVTQIYEGTNGIQALDLVGRKLADGGAAARVLIGEVAATAAASPLPDLAAPVARATDALRATLDVLLARPVPERGGAAVPFLRAFARVLGAGAHLKAAAADPGRKPLAAFYIRRLLPETAALLAAADDDPATIADLDALRRVGAGGR
ncbi:MAG: acyl-CoA dehydrogenase [Rubellimicrobium sp.]|nr:acyl-CoA dehydrogenase [Rubellimicrobium sp.]